MAIDLPTNRLAQARMQRDITRLLQNAYAAALTEPVPERFSALLSQLEAEAAFRLTNQPPR